MSLITALLMIAVFFIAANRGAFPQKLETGPQVLTIFSNVDDSEQPYGLYLPKHFNPAKKYPLVIMLHGAYSNHRIALRRVFGQEQRQRRDRRGSYALFPKMERYKLYSGDPACTEHDGIPRGLRRKMCTTFSRMLRSGSR